MFDIPDWFKKEGAIVKDSPILFTISVLIATAILGAGIFTYEQHYYYAGILTEKDGTIVQKDATITTISEERDAANRENDRLHNDVAAYQAANAAKSSPLKDRAKILAQQLLDFSELTRTNSAGSNWNLQNQYRQEWNGRFDPRLDSILNELDVRGQYSQFIPAGNDYQLPNPDQLKTISSEINRMADALQEPDSP
jgi:hypothetical protein